MRKVTCLFSSRRADHDDSAAELALRFASEVPVGDAAERTHLRHRVSLEGAVPASTVAGALSGEFSFDLVVDLFARDRLLLARAARRLARDATGAMQLDCVALMEVEARIVKDVATAAPPELTMIALLRWKPLGAGEAMMRWREHAPLATEIHRGMCRYEQNEVLAGLRGPHLDAFADFSFETADDYRQRFLAGASDRARIAADVERFVGQSSREFLSRHMILTAR